MKRRINYRPNLLFLMIGLSCTAFSQSHRDVVKFTGEFGLYSDFYRMQSDSMDALYPRRPDFLARLVINTELSVKDFSMPITASLPNKQYSSLFPNVPGIPGAPAANFKLMIKNPVNRIGIAPKYKWAQILLGSQIPKCSELSTGDLSVFGAGLHLTPGKFQFYAFSGTSQLAVEENPGQNRQAIYARTLQTAKIGFGAEDSSHIYLIATRMEDDTSSLLNKPAELMPQNGALGSLDFRINFKKKFYIKGEFAASAFTRDSRSDEMPDFSPDLPDGIFKSKLSSRLDYASVFSAGWNGKNFGLKTTIRYYGDGFVPLGYSFLQTDRLEYTIDPRFSFLKNKVQLSGSIGRRVNNLSGIRSATTTQTLSLANLAIQFSDKFSVAASFSNFGFRNSMMNDTFRLEMVTVAWSISPTYTHSGKLAMHQIGLYFSQNTFTDYNIISGSLNNNDAYNALLSYVFALTERPLSITSFWSYFNNTTGYGNLATRSATLNLGYSFFKKNKLTTSAGYSLASSTIDDTAAGLQMMTLFGAKYTLKKKIQFAANASINLFDYEEARPGIAYQESLVRLSVTYKI